MLYRRLMTGFIAATILIGCASTSSMKSSGDVRAEIERGNAAFVAAANAGRIGDMLALYAPDAMVMPANSPSITGLAGIEQFWTVVAGMKMRNVTLTTDAFEVQGDVAIESGVYTMTLTIPDAGDVNDRGKYLVVWKRQPDGSWKIYRDMFSTNLPAH